MQIKQRTASPLASSRGPRVEPPPSVRSDREGRRDTLISGLTGMTDDVLEPDVADLSAGELLEQSKKADQKLLLLQRQIELMA